MRFLATLLILVCCTFAVMAGEPDSLTQRPVKPLKYVFNINSAVLFCKNCSVEGSLVAMPTTIHGIQWQDIRIGAGVGYTSFGPIRSMPYFGSITFDIFRKKRKNGLFVEWNYGGAHAWVAPEMREGDYGQEAKAWGFMQVSAGYSFYYEKIRLGVQAGFQQLSTKRYYKNGEPQLYPWFSSYISMPPRQTVTEYDTNRFFLTLSIGI